MLRKVVLILILCNLLLWAWAHGVLRPFGWAPARVEEPQRLQQQLHADALVLLGPQGQPLTPAEPASAPSQPAAPASASAARAAGPAAHDKPGAGAASSPTPAASAASVPAPAASGTSSVAQAAQDSASCLRIGPYDGAPDPALGAALRKAGLQAESREQDLPAQWMVLMGPYPDAAALQHKIAELRHLALPPGSFVPVSARPRYMPGIALGVFARREQAQAQLRQLQAHGVQTARVVQRNLGVRAAYWVLPALSAAQAARLRGLPALRAAGLHAQDCPSS